MADDPIYDEMQDLCAQAPGFSPRSLSNANNKWLVKSALQKSIRRGDIQTALRMGEYVYTADDTYCWQGLATMIIEDIGFGDPDLVAYSTQCTLKSVRDKMEPEMLYAGLISRACVADKTRSCCELSLGCDIQADGTDKDGNPKPPWPVPSDYPEMWRQMPSMDTGVLLQVLASTNPMFSYIAACVLRKKLRGGGIEALTEALLVIRDNLHDVAWQRAAMLSFERTADSMSLALFPTMRMFQEADGSEADSIQDDAYPPVEEIKSVPSYAFDMHTMQGNKASKAFHTHLCTKHEQFSMIPWDKTKGPMGALIFIAEGGCVSRRIMSSTLEDMKWFQDYNFMLGKGLPPELCTPETIQIVYDNIHILNEKRKWAAK
jgi:hypothetical protein